MTGGETERSWHPNGATTVPDLRPTASAPPGFAV